MEAFLIAFVLLSGVSSSLLAVGIYRSPYLESYERALSHSVPYRLGFVDVEGNSLYIDSPLTPKLEDHSLFHRVYPSSQVPGDAIPLTLPQPQSQPVVDPVSTADAQPVDVDPVAFFWRSVESFTPLVLDGSRERTTEAVREALRLGISQNQIVFKLFGLKSKGNQSYDQAVAIIKQVRGGMHE